MVYVRSPREFASTNGAAIVLRRTHSLKLLKRNAVMRFELRRTLIQPPTRGKSLLAIFGVVGPAVATANRDLLFIVVAPLSSERYAFGMELGIGVVSLSQVLAPFLAALAVALNTSLVARPSFGDVAPLAGLARKIPTRAIVDLLEHDIRRR